MLLACRISNNRIAESGKNVNETGIDVPNLSIKSHRAIKDETVKAEHVEIWYHSPNWRTMWLKRDKECHEEGENIEHLVCSFSATANKRVFQGQL